jgi:hypothetical protein
MAGDPTAPHRTGARSPWCKIYDEPLSPQQREQYQQAIALLRKLTRRQLQKIKAEVIPQMQREQPTPEGWDEQA